MKMLLGIVVALMLALGSIMAPSAADARLRADAAATTMTDVNLRSGPGMNFGVLRVVPSGASVHVHSGPQSGGWYQVSYSGTTGFIYETLLRQGGVPAQQAQAASDGAHVTTHLNLRAGPGVSHAVRLTIPAGGGVTVLSGPHNGWYEVSYQGTNGFVSGRYLNLAGGQNVARSPGGPKRIEIDLARQWLYAYEGDVRVFDAPVTTGRDGWNTPRGRFSVYAKVPLQDMSGNMRGESWHVPDVPHAMFIVGDVALHGTYWHNLFGSGVRISHGCINLPLAAAEWLYNWTPMHTPVIVY
jgi:uncharacterized protein YraI